MERNKMKRWREVCAAALGLGLALGCSKTSSGGRFAASALRHPWPLLRPQRQRLQHLRRPPTARPKLRPRKPRSRVRPVARRNPRQPRARSSGRRHSPAATKGKPACPTQAWMKANMSVRCGQRQTARLWRRVSTTSPRTRPRGWATGRYRQGRRREGKSGRHRWCESVMQVLPRSIQGEVQSRDTRSALLRSSCMARRSAAPSAKVRRTLGSAARAFHATSPPRQAPRLLEHHPKGITLYELAEAIGVTPRSMRRYLKEVSQELELEPVPTRAGGALRWRVRSGDLPRKSSSDGRRPTPSWPRADCSSR